VRALFFGTPDIAVSALETLNEIATVVGVVCQPDKPAGRGLELKPPRVKTRALALGLDVVQPTKIKTPEFAEWVRAKEADVALVMAYGRILPKAVLEAPRRGCMNLHASLLPRHRGAAPITWAIVTGDRVTGISLMQMDEGLDTGPVYSRREIPIAEAMTAGDLSLALAELARVVVRQDVPRAVEGALAAEPQDASAATIARLLEKEDGRIDWSKPSARVHDHVRGMMPWPGAVTTLNGKLFKILRTELANGDAGGAPGEIVLTMKDRIEVACGEGRVAILKGQLEGKKPLDARNLVAGRALTKGAVLG
jgi:methionyl-tRNA formyltransferase